MNFIILDWVEVFIEEQYTFITMNKYGNIIQIDVESQNEYNNYNTYYG